MFATFDTSVSGLRAERVRMNLIANNLANVNTTRDAQGNLSPFQRRLAVFQPTSEGVAVVDIVESPEAPRLVWDPGHPDAGRYDDFFTRDAEGRETRRPEFETMPEAEFAALTRERIGHVAYSNVEPAREMADAMLASRAYEANVAVLGITKQLISQSLRIIA